MQDKAYPTHIYDDVRREITSQLVHKELIKLFPSLDRGQWEGLLPDINSWFDGEKSQLAPVHDFWNGCDGLLAGFKLKGLITYFTAENVEWRQAEIPVSELSIRWRLPSLKDLGDPPYSYSMVQEYLRDPAVRKEQERVARIVSGSTPQRDEFPIIVLKDAQGTTLLDGNRRLMQAFLEDKSTILAWVGTLQGTRPLGYWVSTAYLRSILRTAEAAHSAQNDAAFAACRQVLSLLFHESVVAQINWDLRCRQHSEVAKGLVTDTNNQ